MSEAPLVPSPPPAPLARRPALLVAIVADLVQFGLLPLFAGGALSPINSALDLVVAFLMVRWLGWHWAFLPAFVAELMPWLDLFPTWTAAVWFVTRTRGPGRPGA